MIERTTIVGVTTYLEAKERIALLLLGACAILDGIVVIGSLTLLEPNIENEVLFSEWFGKFTENVL